jgi:uncharacterized protein
MRKSSGIVIYSPSDLIAYLASPFASWMDRLYLENKELATPDEETEDQLLVARTGDEHEQAVLAELKASGETIAEIERKDFNDAVQKTKAAIGSRVKIVYQGALQNERFAGYTDFLILDEEEHYQLWDTKLARSPKPYYAVQLCCYAEMYAATTGEPMPERFGIILGNGQRVVFRTEDFFHYYRQIKSNFLLMQDAFTGNLNERPEPLAGADHRRWTSHADAFFNERDHLIQVAGITTGQIKKLNKAGLTTVLQLGSATGRVVPKLAAETMTKLADQARLQCATRTDRLLDQNAPAHFELIVKPVAALAPFGLEIIPAQDAADVFFDMEGFPLAIGGLEYLFGVSDYERNFRDWWAHDRNAEKIAFEGFIDWVHERWKANPGMHIYHYAAYEQSAIRRLSIRHDTRQEEVDDLLRNGVLVDLYKIVRQGLRIGENSYSIKSVEHLYRPKRSTSVATAVDSIVQYARWIESGDSTILQSIRDYNEDDCFSTEELLRWLRKVAAENGISPSVRQQASENGEQVIPTPELAERLEAAQQLRAKGDPVSTVLGDLVDFHRREQKPMWWRMFDRADAEQEELCDDPACLHGLRAVGRPVAEKQSQLQTYHFDSAQECKLEEGKTVLFCHDLAAKFSIYSLELSEGQIVLKLSNKQLTEKLGGQFPQTGSLVLDEYVPAKEIQAALCSLGKAHLSGNLPAALISLLERKPPALTMQQAGEQTIAAAIRVSAGMNGGCLVIQGPPGTGKTYTAARMISSLLSAGKRIGVASNSHKAVVNLLCECGKVMRAEGKVLMGIKACGETTGELFSDNPGVKSAKTGKDAASVYRDGVIGGTAWLFSLPEMEGAIDFLFIDEAGQVSLANAVAMGRSAGNIILLGDQMQLEQPIQGSHPGDSGLSVLQYALKDELLSLPDAPIFYPVVPQNYGLFLGESRRMHPEICRFISESIYAGKLVAHASCAVQNIQVSSTAALVTCENGVVFCGVPHDGNVQQSDEEAAMALNVYRELSGRTYTEADGNTRPLELNDFLFISPYNAQVRALKASLPDGARVGSVDKFQGQEAAVCILSLCSSYGEYGSRGLGFILDKNRLNVAISRAKCLAVVIADPRIARTATSSLDEIRLVNLFCKLVLANTSP